MRIPLAVLLAAFLTTGCLRSDNEPEQESSITWERNSSFAAEPRMEVFIRFGPGELGENDPGRRESVNSHDDAIASRPAETPIPDHQGPRLGLPQGNRARHVPRLFRHQLGSGQPRRLHHGGLVGRVPRPAPA